MAKRRTISKRTRFEVFKRDRFRCQYCGKEAPSVVLALRELALNDVADDDAPSGDGLHVDHVVPRAAGGEDSITNYVTACVDCNLGKGSIPLDDDAAVRKQRAQLEDVAARREQVEMMAKWQRELAALDESGVDVAVSLWEALVPGFTLTATGKDKIAKALRKFGHEAVMSAMRTAVQSYVRRGSDGEVEGDSVGVALDKVVGICVNRRKQETLPELPRLYYINGILKNRFPERWDKAESMRLLQRAVRAGIGVDALQDQAADASSYWRWTNAIREYIEEFEADGNTPPRDAPREPAPAPAPPSPTPVAVKVLGLCVDRWGV